MINKEGTVTIKSSKLDESKYVNPDHKEVYYTYFDGIKRVHKGRTVIRVIKIEIVPNSSSGADSIVMSDAHGLQLETVPGMEMISQMGGMHKRYFWAELDFTKNKKGVRLLKPIVEGQPAY